MLAAGTMLGFEENPVRVKSSAAVSSSPTEKESDAVGVSSKIVCGPMVEMTGLRLMCFTVTGKEFVLEAPSGSRTTMLTVAVPYLAEAGVMVRDRSWPLPERTRLEFGKSAWDEENTESVRSSGSDSGSKTLNGTAGRELSSSTD